jgi:hypothetical protein
VGGLVDSHVVARDLDQHTVLCFALFDHPRLDAADDLRVVEHRYHEPDQFAGFLALERQLIPGLQDQVGILTDRREIARADGKGPLPLRRRLLSGYLDGDGDTGSNNHG